MEAKPLLVPSTLETIKMPPADFKRMQRMLGGLTSSSYGAAMDTLSCAGVGKAVGAVDAGAAKHGRVDDSKLLADTRAFASAIC